MAKELKKIEEAAEKLGYVLYRKTKGGHTMYQHTITGKLVTLGGTPSDHRSFQNALSKLRANAK